MNNHPRGSCVFMCVLLCIGVLIAMGFSQSTALLINEYSSVSQNPLQKLQTRQPPNPPTKIEEPLQVTLSCICSFLSIYFWSPSFSPTLNGIICLASKQSRFGMITCWEGFCNPHINKHPTPQLISVSLASTPTHTCANTQRELFQKEIGSTLSAYLACVQCAANW